MAIVQTGVFALHERFPDQKEVIRSLFEKSETFKTLCEDHRKCCGAIRYWDGKEGDVAFERRQEYEALLWDLEEEILEFLKDCPQ
jgi:hypothetical protein